MVIHDLEQKRVDYIKVQDKMKREKENNVKTFKVCNKKLLYLIFLSIHFQSADQVEKEKNDSKWETSKVYLIYFTPQSPIFHVSGQGGLVPCT